MITRNWIKSSLRFMRPFDFSVRVPEKRILVLDGSERLCLAAGFIMIREATEDTILQMPNPVGQEGTTPLPVAKGTHVIVDMVGVREWFSVILC